MPRLRDELNAVRRARGVCADARRAARWRGLRLRQRLLAHPWALLGAGFGAGVLAGHRVSRSPRTLPVWLAPLPGVLVRSVLARLLGP